MPGTQRHLPGCFLDISPQGASPEVPPCPYLAWHRTWSIAGRRQRGSGRCWAGVCPWWSLSSVPLYPRTYVGAGLHGHMCTHTHTHTHTHMQTHTVTGPYRQTHTHPDTQRNTQTHTRTYRDTSRHTDTDRHIDTHTQRVRESRKVRGRGRRGSGFLQECLQ